MSILRRRTASFPSGRILTALVLVVGAVFVLEPGAAASTITRPSAPPHVDANAPLEVVATGFTPGQNVFVEQCDGVSPTAQGWNVTLDCDLGGSPPPAIADVQGTATFPADDVNRAFHPFEGESPQSLFNCMAAGKRAPNNQLSSFTNCKLRVSSNNSSATGDQVFLPIVLTGRSVPKASRGASSSTTTTIAPAPGITTPKSAAQKAAAARRAGKEGSVDHEPATTSHLPAADPRSAAAIVPPASKGSSGAGLLGLSDSGVRTGYLLLLLGLLITFLPLLLAPRRRRTRADVPTQPVTSTEPAGEGT